ncbi:MAG: hypothetical protein ACLSAC_11250 [Enterocloster bolteae]
MLAQKLWVTPKVSHMKLDRVRQLCMEADGRKQEPHCHRASWSKRNSVNNAEPLYERLAKYFEMLKNNKFVEFRRNCQLK